MAQEEREKQQRRKYSPAGTRGQKMMSFRIDSDNVEFLSQQPNKGLLINKLLRKLREEWKQKRIKDFNEKVDAEERRAEAAPDRGDEYDV